MRIEPKYPMEAQKKGIQGCVRLLFDLTPAGEVINIRVIEAWPEGVFEQASISALKRWVYKPIGSDHSFELKDMKAQLDYKN